MLVGASDFEDILKALSRVETPEDSSSQLSDDSTTSLKSKRRNRISHLRTVEGSLGNGLGVQSNEVFLSGSGVRVAVEGVPSRKVKEVDVFFICMDCGKVFWEGGHFERTLKRHQQYM